MTKLFLAAGVAALAIAAPAVAGQDRGGKSKVEKSDRGDKARAVQTRKASARSNDRQVERKARSSERSAERPARATERRAERPARAVERRAERPTRAVERRAERPARAVDRNDRARVQQVDRQERRVERRANVQESVADRRADRFQRLAERRDLRMDRAEDRQRNLNVLRQRDWTDRVIVGNANGWTNGCPPGLAKKPVACIPPGQVRNFVGAPLNDVARIAAISTLPQSLRYMYPDNDDYMYRYGNGYVYQVDRESQLISALLPLFGLGVPVGQSFPSAYSNYMVPSAYQPFYQDTSDYYYRYGDGYVYQVGRNNGLVMDYMPLLANGYGYGQMMPLSYSAYNVPYQYRSFYQDSDDYYYRYAPGSIYRVDAGSGLIDSIAALLMTGGMSVGQPMPMGYDAYNVPFQYRSQYYDTPDNMYRYANGNIYQIDPTTRLVTALISALV